MISQIFVTFVSSTYGVSGTFWAVQHIEVTEPDVASALIYYNLVG